MYKGRGDGTTCANYHMAQSFSKEFLGVAQLASPFACETRGSNSHPSATVSKPSNNKSLTGTGTGANSQKNRTHFKNRFRRLVN